MMKPTIIGLRVLGIDGSLNNFGVATGYYTDKEPVITGIHLLASNSSKTNKIRNDAERAKNIARFLLQFDYDMAIAEIPYGSKSYRAAWSLGITLGLISSVTPPILFVTPYDVKNVVKRGAAKSDMINWAVHKYGGLNWRYYNGRLRAENEHLADAIAVIHAGYRKLKSGNYQLL